MGDFRMKRHVCLALFLSLLIPAAFAEVKLPAIIGDNMALQRGSEIPIWGWGAPYERVSVCFNGKSTSTTACCDGKWMVKLDLPCAGGPYDMTVSGSTNSIAIKNVVVGEVWVCSG